MTLDMFIVLFLLAVAVFLFATEILSVGLVTFILLIALVTTGILTVDQAFAGFGAEITLILVSIFVINGALQETGILDVLGSKLMQVAGRSALRVQVAVLPVAAFLSAFMNNTTVTALFLPPVLGMARRARISPSRLLMPLSFASILGGTCTLIGTSTNVAVSGYLRRQGLEPLGMFELTPLGLVLVVAGVVYLLLLGPRLLPDHPDESLTEDYNMRDYLTEIVVLPGSKLIEQRVFESAFAGLGFRVLRIVRAGETFAPDPRTAILTDDILLVEGPVKELLNIKSQHGIEIRPEHKLGDQDLQTGDIKIAEVLVTPQSDLVRRTLKEVEFRQRFGLTVIALYRHGRSLRDQLGKIKLKVGDLLLVQGAADRLDPLHHSPDLAILEQWRPPHRMQKRGLQVLGFFAGAIVAGSMGWLPLPIAFVTAAVLTLITGRLSVQEASEFIDWRLIILIAGMTAFGTAMEQTGTAAFLAQGIVQVMAPLGTYAILCGFVVLTILLTQPLSNAAAALVVLPIALQTAVVVGANPRTFGIGIMLAASISFIAPFEPSCMLVYGPGKYRFADFVRLGLGLTVLSVVIVLFLVPLYWPLH